MGYNHASAYFLIALIFFATANPLAHAQPSLPNLTNATVIGSLCCTPTGNCPPGSPPVAGALVVVNCTNLITGTVATIGQAITTADGSFSINVSAASLLSNPLGCVVRVGLPLNSTICNVFSNSTGALVGIIGPITLLLGQLFATVSSLFSVSL